MDGNVDKDVFEREVETCAKIKVKPDRRHVDSRESRAYRKSGAVLFVKRYAAIAAVVALGIVVGYLFHEKRRIFHGGFTRDCG
ncbi:MAG: hypothetical protein ACLU4J_12125 [Butyricimonas paravirosa]